MKFLIALLFSTQVFAQQAVIFSGQNVKALKPNLDLFGQSKIMSGSVNPTSVAVNANFGSLYLNSTTGRVYKKNDSGSSTNWYEVVDTSTAQTIVNKTIDATLNTITNIQDSMIDSEASTAGQVLTSDGAGGASWQNSSATVSTTTVEFAYQDYMVVRVISSAGNIPLATGFENGDTVNGVVLATNDIIGIAAQTNKSENGIYTVNASGAPTRHPSYDTFQELNRATMYATEGTSIPEYAFHQVETLTSLADDQTWASSPAIDTFVVPTGVTKLSILACGGGGAGGNGGRVANPNAGSAGGGAGGNGGPPLMAEVTVVPGDTVEINLGRGGRRVMPISSGVALDGGDGTSTNINALGPPTFDLWFPGGAGGAGANGSNEGLTSSNFATDIGTFGGGLSAINGGTGGSGSPTASSGVDGYRSLYAAGGAGGLVSVTGGGGGGGAGFKTGGAGAAGVSGTNNGLDGLASPNRCGGGGGGSGARVNVSGSTRIGGGGGQGGVGYVRITY